MGTSNRSRRRAAAARATLVNREERVPAAAPKKGEITDRLETLDAVTAGLVSDAEALASVLEPILVTHPTAEKSKGQEERMSATSVGGRIGSAIDTVTAARLRLQDLVSRAAL